MQLVSRFDSFLSRKNYSARRDIDRFIYRYPGLAGLENAVAPYERKGLLVMDAEPSRETAYRNMLESFRNAGHEWGHLKHVIEAPFFVDSAGSVAIQVADLCAYAVRRYIEFGVPRGPNSNEERNFKRIFTRFDRSSGKLHGLRHYCNKGTCACMVCIERGHSGELPGLGLSDDEPRSAR